MRFSVASGKVELLNERIKLLEEQLKLKEAMISALQFDLNALKNVISTPAPSPSAVPLFISEREEDIRYAKDHQMISTAEAEDMLRQLNFDNAEIYIDDPTDEVSLY